MRINKATSCIAMCIAFCAMALADEEAATLTPTDGVGRIILEAHSDTPKPPVFYAATADAVVNIKRDTIDQTIELQIRVVQGDSAVLSFGLNGDDNVTDVQGEHVLAWSVRKEGERRFLDIHPAEKVTELGAKVTLKSSPIKLPSNVSITHLTPGKAVGFSSKVRLQFAGGVAGKVLAATGFSPLGNNQTKHFQSTTGGKLEIGLSRDGAAPAAVELTNATLKGQLHEDSQSMGFQFQATALVTEPGAELTILAGNAAPNEFPTNGDYRLELKAESGKHVYKLIFPKVGEIEIDFDFVATIVRPNDNWQGTDFTVASGAVVPITIAGIGEDLEFQRATDSIVPLRKDSNWIGFLPATGRARLLWRSARQTGDGKLFFTTTAMVEAKLGAGLLRQQHHLDYKVLQGELPQLQLSLTGPGEILDVQGTGVTSWKVSGENEARQLEITLSQPVTDAAKLKVLSQTAIGAFPVRVDGLRVTPEGAIRHSGHLRLTNSGSVRLEPTNLSGLSQLAPDQYPGEAIESRQNFVYRFPSADYQFTVVADRIQPEVNVAQLVVYELTETDRSIKADIELDIREAPIREWDFEVPADYSVVSVTGAAVADYVASTEEVDGRRNLKVIFGKDVSGRMLVVLHLEKNETAAPGSWALPKIEYPEAKTIRGDIGVVGAAGFRITAPENNRDFLVEKPLSYFPKPSPNLQQAFRIREPRWFATVEIAKLDGSVQADLFHLYSLSRETIYGSALINYFVTGAPVSKWEVTVPESLANVTVDGKDVRMWRREGDKLTVTLHQPVMGAYTLLVTFEEEAVANKASFQPGQVKPQNVNGERGFIQVGSPQQVEMKVTNASDSLLTLAPLELPAEFRLLSAAPSLGTWQYTERPFQLDLEVNWFQSGTTVDQVVEFAEASSRVSKDGELVTDVLYYVKSRGQRALRVKLPEAPVRLWEVTVAGQTQTARQTADATLIPLPGGVDPNVPIEVRLRLGKPSTSAGNAQLALPIVYAPVLKTNWTIDGDEQRVLVPGRGSVTAAEPVLRPTGFHWVAQNGLGPLLAICIFSMVGAFLVPRSGASKTTGIAMLLVAMLVCLFMVPFAGSGPRGLSQLRLSLPILAAGESVDLQVQNLPLWMVNMSWQGLFLAVIGLLALVASFTQLLWLAKMLTSKSTDDESQETSKANAEADLLRYRPWLRVIGIVLLSIGALMQRDRGVCFFGLLAALIFCLLLAKPLWEYLQAWATAPRKKPAEPADAIEPNTDTSGGAVTALLIFAAAIVSLGAMADNAVAKSPIKMLTPDGFGVPNSIVQDWHVSKADSRLLAEGKIVLSGEPGDRFVLLRAPGVLTNFTGDGLRVTKDTIPGLGLAYVVSIPSAEVPESTPDESDDAETEASNPEAEQESNEQEYTATFEYQLEAVNAGGGIPVLTSIAAVQEIDLRYDEPGWAIASANAVRVQSVDSENETRAKVLLGPGHASITLRPKARDVNAEETKFFVEGSNLFVPGPGVVDGRHRLEIRTSQGVVEELAVQVPLGLTVSAVNGPVSAWRFNADNGQLSIELESAQSQTFQLMIETQRGLDPLPVDIELSPVTVTGANGQVGLVAVAFGPDAQPEKVEPTTLSAVNLSDFDGSMVPKSTALHRVYRYGQDAGQLALRVAPVKPEVRVTSKQVLSLGDERVVLAVNFIADISRAGLFQMSFPLPEGLDVESLTGPALHHWSELTENEQRQIVLHLNGKTIGRQNFSITLSGAFDPAALPTWALPRFELNEANRQTGDLVVRPTAGIRLRTTGQKSISETDPRTIGGQGQGALAFRLLQRDWELELGIEKLEPRVTGNVLHEVTLREGQTRTALLCDFTVQNASIRELEVELPIQGDDEIKTLRVTGSTVSDPVRSETEPNVWIVKFKRRIIGDVQFRIEYERRGDRANDKETLVAADFKGLGQLYYHFAVRAGGRLDVRTEDLPSGWQRVDWSVVSQRLREAGTQAAPALTLRAANGAGPISILAERHSVADALKLRVKSGELTTVLSPNGDQLTSVDLQMEVIQRSSLSIGLPEGGELFSIFVNGESVNSIRKDGDGKSGGSAAWQFHILPGMDDRTATVRFVYSLKGDRLGRLKLSSPEMNVPLEDISWNVLAPEGYKLASSQGNLELLRSASTGQYDRQSYLAKASGKREEQAQRAASVLQKANKWLMSGKQSKALWAFNNVANRNALDAASNEDARVQLENLQTQQAIVGLNTRRQRLYLDNDEVGLADNRQLKEAASVNPVLQMDQMNFQPQQLSQLLQGNTTEDNKILQQIAVRLVQHQRSSEPAPQAIVISLPEEGSMYTFARSVQVAENEPLELDLRFRSRRSVPTWQMLGLFLTLGVFGLAFVVKKSKQPVSE